MGPPTTTREREKPTQSGGNGPRAVKKLVNHIFLSLSSYEEEEEEEEESLDQTRLGRARGRERELPSQTVGGRCQSAETPSLMSVRQAP